MTQDKAQAAGAVSIDSPEFRELLVAYRHELVSYQEEARQKVFAYADAHAAQRYEAGYRKGCAATLIGPVVQGWQERADRSDASLARAEAAEAELEEWRFTNRIDELQRRCGRAEASLARLVEGIDNTISNAIYGYGAQLEDHAGAVDAIAKALRALLPAKADTKLQANAGPLPGDMPVDRFIASLPLPQYPSTPAPAMGEELPPPVATASKGAVAFFVKWTETGKPLQGIINLFTADQMHAYGRACMALRQPGAETAGKQWVLAKETVVEFPGSRPDLGYTLLSGVGVFASFEEVSATIAEFKLPLGWVAMTLEQLLPGAMLSVHTPAAPVSQPAAQDEDSDWRRLALQFDGHRMQALGHLKAMVQDPAAHTPVVEQFLAAGPLSGEEVLAERIKAIAERTASQPAAQEPRRDFATPRVDALKELWADDGASRGAAYICMRDLAAELEHELRNTAPAPLSAPAGSEKERTAARYAILRESVWVNEDGDFVISSNARHEGDAGKQFDALADELNRAALAAQQKNGETK